MTGPAGNSAESRPGAQSAPCGFFCLRLWPLSSLSGGAYAALTDGVTRDQADWYIDRQVESCLIVFPESVRYTAKPLQFCRCFAQYGADRMSRQELDAAIKYRRREGVASPKVATPVKQAGAFCLARAR